LDKLRILFKRLQSADHPSVIEKYEEVTGSNTVDQKIEELEKRQRDTEFQFVDATHALKRKFPPQQPAALVNNIVVQAPTAVQQTPTGRLQEIKMPDFHGDRAQYPKFKSMFDMNIHARGDL
jgi:NAD-dependent DNA ligase